MILKSRILKSHFHDFEKLYFEKSYFHDFEKSCLSYFHDFEKWYFEKSYFHDFESNCSLKISNAVCEFWFENKNIFTVNIQDKKPYFLVAENYEINYKQYLTNV